MKAGFVIALMALAIVCFTAETQENTTQYWIDRADESMNNGSIKGAVSAYDEALKIDPDNTTILIHKASELSVLGRVNESSDTYDRTIELIPSGNVQERSGYWMSKAEVLAIRGLSDDGPRTDLLEEALTAINHSLELDPKSSSKWHFKATILSELDRKDEAVEAFDEGLRLNPENADNWLWKANLLVEMKRYNESLESYDKAIELIAENNSEDLATNWFSKGWALNKTGRTDEARTAFQKSLEFYETAISENVGNNRLLQQKGMVLFELGRYDEAIEAYDQVLKKSLGLEFDTTAVSAWIGKGDSLRLQGKNEDALVAYNKAIDLGPHYSNAWHGRGEAQKAMGQVGNASLSFLVADKLGYEE